MKGKKKMMLKKETISKKEKDDIRTLMRFVGIYCHQNHPGAKKPPILLNDLISKKSRKGRFPSARIAPGF